MLRRVSRVASITIVIIGLFLGNSQLFASVPPHPRVVKLLRENKISPAYYLQHRKELLQRGLNAPWSSTQLQERNTINKQSGIERSLGSSKSPLGSWKALVLLVQFSDKPQSVNPVLFDSLLFGNYIGTMRNYFKAVSYNNLDIVTVNMPSSVGWKLAPQTYAYYVNGQNGFGAYPRNAQRLTEDVIAAADASVDFSQYDNDLDGYVDALFVVHTGQGAEYTGSNNDIWSHAWVISTPQVRDGVTLYRYSMEPEYWAMPGDMTCGVYAHELGHAGFGLPDLYDTDYSSEGLGNWSLMAGGSWNGALGLGDSPAFPDAWSQFQMGYLTPTNITSGLFSQSIHNTENTPEVFRLWTNGIMGNEYFLVQNRQQVGYDTYLPGSGLLIYHVDESVMTGNDNEWYPGHTSSGHYLVALEQADGLYELEKGLGRGNSGDTYPGSTANRSLTSSTLPNSKNYSGLSTNVSVNNISNSSLIMTADLQVGVIPGGPVIVVNPDTIKWGLSAIGFIKYDTILVGNGGSSHLIVSNITSSLPVYTPDITSFTVPSGATQPVVVAFAPISNIAYNGAITISSNDSLHPTVKVIMQGQGYYPPSITVVPDSFAVTLTSGDSLTQTMTIGNTGLSSLNWSIDHLFMLTDNPTRDTRGDIKRTQLSEEESFDGLNDSRVHLSPERSAAQVPFFDSFESGNFDDWEIDYGGGTREVTTATSAHGLYSFHYQTTTEGHYQGIHHDFAPASNPEYISFFVRPGTTVLANSYCVFVDSVDNNIIWFYATRDGRLYVNQDVGGDSSVAYSAFEWYFIEFRNIDWTAHNFDYYVDGSLIKADIPFRVPVNELRRLYVYNLRITEAWWDAFNIGGVGGWLSTIPNSGIVAPGATQNVAVKFDASLLRGGDYKSEIVINSNDPVNNPKNIPASMHVVGKPAIEVLPDTVKAGLVFIGSERVDIVNVRNVGTDILNVTNITSSLPVFTTNVTSFSLPSGEVQAVEVRFAPTDPVVYNGTLTISSNDSLHPTTVIVLEGQGGNPPIITISPDSVSADLFTGESTTRTLTISNSGASDLTFNGTIAFGVSSKDNTLSANRAAKASSYKGAIQAGAEYEENQVIIKFYGGNSSAQAQSIRTQLGATIVKTFPSIGAQLLRLSGISVADAIARYKDNPNVRYVEPNYRVRAFDKTPNDPMFSQLWGMQKISAPAAWDRTTGTDIIIGDIDTGIDPSHADLAANIWTNPGEIPGNGIDDDANGYIDDIHGWDFVNNDNNPYDDHSHGTHTAGTIAAVGNNGVGVVGVCWSAKIMALKFLDAGGSGDIADAVTALEYATMMHAKLTNNSWGGGGYSQAMYDAIEAAGNSGALFIAAAGNSGLNADIYLHYPSCYDLDNIISVASTNSTDGLSYFSNYGLVNVDLGAPGENVTSTIPGNSYGTKDGTSMATPHVSGAAGLVLSLNPLLSWAEVKNIILTSVDPVPSLSGKTVTGGRLNAAEALEKTQTWIKLDPLSGTVPPGMSTDLTVTFDAARMYGGDYRSMITIYSNDPIHSTKNIPASLHVSGKPVIAVEPDTVKAGIVYLGTSHVDTVKVKNLGSDVLNVMNITSTLPAFIPGSTNFDVQPGMEYIVSVTFTPVDSIPYNGILTILSNDSLHPIVNIALHGRGAYPPDVSVTPDSLLFVVNEGDSVSAPITISNSGIGELSYEVKINYASKTPSKSPQLSTSLPREWVNKFKSNTSSSQAKQPIFKATPSLPLIIQDPIGDAIDVDISEVRGMCGSGVLSIQIVTATKFDPIDFAGYFGLDIDQNPATGMALPVGLPGQDVGCEFVLGFFNLLSGVDMMDSLGYYVGTFPAIIDTAGNNFTFSIPLTSLNNDDGRINIAGVLGNTYGPTDYVPDLGHGTIGPSWLSAMPTEGKVVTGGSQIVSVKANGAMMTPGLYHAIVVLENNDPFHNPTNVPVSLQVIGKPIIVVSPDSVKAGIVYIGTTRVDTVKVRNTGSDVLNVTGITSTLPEFTTSVTTFSVSPYGEQAVAVSFIPTDTIAYNGILSISSNDSLHPSVDVVLMGKGEYPPFITVAPDSLEVVLNEKDSTSTIITVGNIGSSVLSWSGSINYVSTLSEKTVGSMLNNSGTHKVIEAVGNQSTNSTELQGPTLNSTNPSSGPVVLAGTYSGDHLNFGITDYGEIMPFQYPIGTEHLQIGWWGSGYTLAYKVGGIDRVKYAGYDSRSGIVPVSYKEVVNDPSNLIVEVVTQTDDGCLKVIRTFSFDKHDKYIRIKTDLKNMSASTLEDVVLKSWADWDVDGNISTNDWNYEPARNMVYASEVHFTAIAGQRSPYLMDIGGWDDYFQRLTTITVPIGPVYDYDGLAILHYELGDLSSGAITGIMDAYGAGNDLLELRSVIDRALKTEGWLSIKPTSGNVPAQSSMDIEVDFKTGNLKGGVYKADIVIASNDPINNPKKVPVSLRVIGKPVIVVAPDTVNAHTVFVGMSHYDTVQVKNIGSDVLNVTGITSSLPEFTTSAPIFSVLPGQEHSVVVKFSPMDSIAYNGVLTISSNDSLHPSVNVVLKGKGAYPPIITVSPDSLSFIINEKDSASAPLTISNIGSGPLVWSVNQLGGTGVLKQYTLPVIHTVASIPDMKMSTPENILSGEIISSFADLTGKRIGWFCFSGTNLVIRNDLSSRGAKNYLLSYPITSTVLDTLDVFVVDDIVYNLSPAEILLLRTWVQTGHSILIQGDDATSMVNINALLSGTGITDYSLGGYYSEIFTDIVPHQITMGVDSINSQAYGSYCDAILPARTLVRDLSNNSHVVISSLGSGRVMVYCNELTEDFSVSIYNDNRILVNRTFDWLAERGSAFISVEPAMGTVAPGSSQVVTVKANAQSGSSGLHRMDLALYNNDPLHNPTIVPISMLVIGKPVIAITPDTLKYHSIVGVTSIDTLCISNIGSDVLSVSSILPSDTAFHPNRTSFIVSPGGQELVLIGFTPSFSGIISASLTITSNDSAAIISLVPIAGEALYPPIISISPDSIVASVVKKDSTTRTMRIQNMGLSDLQFGIATVQLSSSSSIDAIVTQRHNDNLISNVQSPAPITSTEGNAVKEGGSITPSTDVIAELPHIESSWITRAPMVNPRGQHGVVAHSNGKIFVFGGYNSSGEMSSLEIYNPQTNLWTSGTPMPVANRGMAFATDNNGFIYCLGGISTVTNCYRYNPSTDSWSLIAPMPIRVWEGSATKGYDGRIYVFGGEGGPNVVQIYNPTINTWSLGNSMPTSRHQLSVVEGAGGFIYVLGGGYQTSSPLKTVEVYDPRTNSWSLAAPMITARRQFAACLSPGGKIYAIGGKTSYFNNEGPFFKVVEIYDPAMNSWAVGDSLPITLGEMEAVTAQNMVYILGGTNGTFVNYNFALGVSMWLNVTPAAGVVAPGAGQDIIVELNARDLLAGDYSANIIVHSNDPLDSTKIIPVHLTVTNSVGVVENDQLIPRVFELQQNYPNPFNPATTIRYSLPVKSSVRIQVFNILGQTVAELVNQEQNAGYQSVVWNARIASGIYFYRIEATTADHSNKRFVETKKMLLLK